ncbi:hypothetical protein B4N89_18475 [Embleya scabrispora]|uniref:LPXTG cell wall anchor domain-containing protein n=1 Tax=Embleya scabrispora TaxID=159449 RepID=A0A1T3P0Z6_9ACTN|nr:hypothetical protein [Embleya scabrispora]OPC82664.1 hypothetical protein B4N89_18475 [Embleya scabrispora]
MALSASRPAGAALALVCAVGPVLALAAPAAAEPLTVPVHCVIPLDQPAVDGPQQISLDGPTDPVRPGEKARIKVTLGGSPATSPLPFPGTPLTPSIQLVLSGGASGELTLQGPKMRVDIPGTPALIVVPPYEGEITVPLDARGDIRIAPGKMVTTTAIFGDQITTCFPTAPAPPAMTLRVDLGGAAPDGPSATPGDPTAGSPPASGQASVQAPPERTQDPTASAARGPDAMVESRGGDDGEISGGTIIWIVAGGLILLMAASTMVFSWRRHKDDEW